MLTVEEALAPVLERANPLAPRVAAALIDALGCALAEDVAADVDQPPFDKALVDGYAVRAADLRRPATAGSRSARRSSPARPRPVPSAPRGGRDHDRRPAARGRRRRRDASSRDPTRRRHGRDRRTRRRGPGQNRLLRGPESTGPARSSSRAASGLSPASLGLLASVGQARVLVVPRPRVAIVPTGDELVEPDQVPGPGQIRNSNAVMLQALARRAPGRRSMPLPIAPDEPGELARDPDGGPGLDVLLITGGVSAGSRDLVPGALEDLGVDPDLPQGPAQARQAALVRRRARPRRPAGHAGLRPARQPGQRPGRFPAVRPAGTRIPGGAIRARRPSRRGAAWRRRSPTAATGRPITRAVAADRPRHPRRRAHRAAALGRLGRPARRWPGPTVSPFSPPATGLSRQEKLSDSCRSTRMRNLSLAAAARGSMAAAG